MNQSELLDFLKESGPMTAREISEATGCNIGSVNRKLRGLRNWRLVDVIGLKFQENGFEAALYEAVAS